MSQNSTAGFTLVELIVVMVLIGIVAAIAIPRYIDLTSSANTQAIASVAAALGAASANNYAVRTANSSQGVTITNCQNFSAVLSGGLPSGYSIASTTLTAGGSATCTLSLGTATQTFRGLAP